MKRWMRLLRWFGLARPLPDYDFPYNYTQIIRQPFAFATTLDPSASPFLEMLLRMPRLDPIDLSPLWRKVEWLSDPRLWSDWEWEG